MLTDAQKKEKKHQYYLKNKDKWKKYRETARGKRPRNLRRYVSLRPLFGEPIKVDSIVGIPCFGCYQNDCNPKSCEKLIEWLESEKNVE